MGIIRVSHRVSEGRHPGIALVTPGAQHDRGVPDGQRGWQRVAGRSDQQLARPEVPINAQEEDHPPGLRGEEGIAGERHHRTMALGTGAYCDTGLRVAQYDALHGSAHLDPERESVRQARHVGPAEVDAQMAPEARGGRLQGHTDAVHDRLGRWYRSPRVLQGGLCRHGVVGRHERDAETHQAETEDQKT